MSEEADGLDLSVEMLSGTRIESLPDTINHRGSN